MLQKILVALLLLSCVAADPATKPVVPMPRIVKREEWGSKGQPLPEGTRQVPKFITLHHGGVKWKPGMDPATFVRNVQAWGQKREAENAALPADQQKKTVKNWPDLPYHFMVAPDGRIFEARPIEYQPQSNTTYDLDGHIGVELMGNFEVERPSAAQLKCTVALVAWLCEKYGISPDQVGGHKDRAKGQTVCPGRDFERYIADGEFIGWVRETLAGKTPNVRPGEPLAGGPTVVINTPVATTRPSK